MQKNNNKLTINIWNGAAFDEVEVKTDTPTGQQILDENNYLPTVEHILIQIKADNDFNEIALDSEISLSGSEDAKFIAFHSERSFKFVFNGRRMTWGDKSIKVSLIRTLFNIDSSFEIVMERKNRPDKVLKDSEDINLSNADLERIYTQKQSWKLKVQDVVLTILSPSIIVKDALVQAGIDPSTGWTAAIKYKDAPREPINLDGVIDLTRKGIEKLWLRPNEIHNGEVSGQNKREFALRDQDEAYLNKSDLNLDTVVDNGRRWAILRQFALPPGYNVDRADIAIEIPPTYPTAQLDMFYCLPHLSCSSGAGIPKTDSRQVIEGDSFQRWSRHRQGETKWKPETDSIITHIAIIADSLNREVGL